jgi:ribonuclease P protein component
VLHHAPVAVVPKPATTVVVGAVLPKRWAKRAVTRNTLKRQIYAVSETFALCLRPGCYIVRLRAEFSRQRFTSATSDALKLAVRAELHALFGAHTV